MPAERSGCDAQAADRVPDVVLAVAKGAFPVFPRLAPDDRGKSEEESSVRKSFEQVLEAVVRPACPQLQRMLPGGVVMEGRIRRKPGDPVAC